MEKKEGAVDCSLENPSGFAFTADEELVMIGPPCFLPKNTTNSLAEKEQKTALNALNSISYFMYAALTLVKIFKNGKRIMQT